MKQNMPAERGVAEEELVGHHAGRPEVDRSRVRPLHEHFGGEVVLVSVRESNQGE